MKKTTETTKAPAIHRTFKGVVTSVKEDKTIHVQVESVKTHPKYRKQYKTHKKYAVHDETNQADLNDIVEFQECRPLSKTKRWRLVRIIKKSV